MASGLLVFAHQPGAILFATQILPLIERMFGFMPSADPVAFPSKCGPNGRFSFTFDATRKPVADASHSTRSRGVHSEERKPFTRRLRIQNPRRPGIVQAIPLQPKLGSPPFDRYKLGIQ